jgi:hypothetical protein
VDADKPEELDEEDEELIEDEEEDENDVDCEPPTFWPEDIPKFVAEAPAVALPTVNTTFFICELPRSS